VAEISAGCELARASASDAGFSDAARTSSLSWRVFLWLIDNSALRAKLTSLKRMARQGQKEDCLHEVEEWSAMADS
jgi:hypothetical protein